ncbi:MAG: hypothetical protein K2H72_03185 [Muribaculaceae bacterium]|nr:hypothetical protein [Muribaculaceae bacterium]
MKTKIDLKKIKALVISLALLAFFFGGWVLFVFSETNKHREIARELNLQAERIMNQTCQRDSAFSSDSNDSVLLLK